MKTVHFMFGIYPVKYYNNGKEAEMIQSLKNGDGMLTTFTDSITDIAAFVDSIIGWEEFVILSEKEYKSIKFKLVYINHLS